MSNLSISDSQELAKLRKRVSDLEAREAGLQADYGRLQQLYEQDISQKRCQEQRDAERELLHICHTSNSLDVLMHALVVFFQNLTHCEAVGVRLRRGEDFPYYETRGFPEAFVRAENSLCARDYPGDLLRESTGSPVLECMCGNIISGRFDPAKPFFTQSGSFWTNSTSNLLATTSEADRQARTRNRCNGEGYESVALIPLRVQDATFGLFQFNDHQRDRFSPVIIKQLEDMVSYVAIALAKLLTDETLRHAEETYSHLIQNSQDALRESEANLQRAMRIARIGMWEYDVADDCFIFNDQIYTLYHTTAEHEGGYRMSSAQYARKFVHPDNAALVGIETQKALEATDPDYSSQIDHQIICADGEIRFISVSIRLEKDRHGRTVKTYGVNQDITEQKRAEDALKKSEEIHRVLVKNLPDVVMRFDRAGRHLFVSENVSETVDMKADQFIGKTHSELGFPEDKCRFWEEAIQGVFDSGVSYDGEHSFMGKKGPVIHNWRLVPELDEQGRVTSVLSLSRDITAFRIAEKNYQTLFSEMLDGFALHEIICDDDGIPVNYRFLTVNRAFEHMTGLQAKDIIGRSVLDVMPGTESYWIETYGRVVITGEPAFFENISNELKKYFEVTAYRPAPNQFACIFSDITERKRAEEEKKLLQTQLQQAQKMEAIGTLAGGIAHDFNNILGAILGYAEMAREDSAAGSVTAGDLDQVIKAGNRAKDLVKQILAFSRQTKAEQIPLQPAAIVKESIKLLRSSLPTTIVIQQDIDPDLNMVVADPTHIHQILMNLCTNAYHAMEETSGILSISLKNKVLSQVELNGHPEIQPGSFVHLSISDSGPGIAPEIRERIFEPYFTTKEVGKGTGMGLAIVHGLVKSYGGFIVCRSAIGEGTVFDINLPAMIEPSVPETKPVTINPVGNERILFIDDEKILTEMAGSMLERLGYTVTAHTSSLEALATFIDQPDAFDLVITDQTMPGMTGLDLSRRMLQIRPDLPIILCTGYSSQVSEEKARSAGIRGFALKPLAKTDIAALIRKVLDEGKSSGEERKGR